MTVRWGFLGAGWIARTALAPAVHAARGADLVAVASRDPRRSAALEPQRVHDSYEALLDDPDIDAVYINLANSQHLEWSLRALEAGKHVLCEKPLCLDAAEVDRLIQAAQATNLLLVEATWARWHPRSRRIEHLARSGDLGTVQWVDAAFAFPGDHIDNYRGRKDMGGGALLDVGCYLLHSLVSVLGDDFRSTIQSVAQEVGYQDVDLTTRFRLHAGRAEMTGFAAIAAPEEQRLVVRGSDLELSTLEGMAYTSWCESSSLRVGDHVEEFPVVDAYEVMVHDVSRRVEGQDVWVLPLAETRRVVSLMDAIDDAARD